MTNRFCFLAIVRDEEPVIERCLESVKNLATSYLICDTGSKDNTIDKIIGYMAGCGIPGEVIQKEWVSYGETKSALLKDFRDHPRVKDAKYICWLDADEVFIMDRNNLQSYPTKKDADRLYEYLESRQENVFRMTTIYDSLDYQRWQIARNDQLYVWKLPYQEYFTGTVSYVTHDLDFIWNFSRHQGNSSRDPDIMKKRIAMSKAWLARNPDDSDAPRLIFYLAEALIGVDNPEAIRLYKKRLDLPGYYQENYISLLKLADLVENEDEKIAYWIQAQNLVPNRLEAFHNMLMYCNSKRRFRQSAAIYFAAPESRTYPSDAIFIRRIVYDYLFDLNATVGLHYNGNYKEAYDLGVTVLTKKLPAEDRRIAENNVAVFRKTLPLQPATDNDKPRTGMVPSASPLPSVIVIDNFYDDPMKIRKDALSMEFLVKGNYPGARTKSMATEEMKKRFENIVGRTITYWPDTYNGSFQYTTKDNKSWIHRDLTDFSVVIYLTPDPPLNAGTVLYRHKVTGLERTTTKEQETMLNEQGNDESLWEVTDRVGNKFNRAIIFQGFLSHKSDVYFGDDLHTGRLFQTFFFNVEGRKF